MVTLKSDIQNAVRILREGGVIIYPTDTVYGLGADATNISAVETVRRIKGRDADKPILVMVRDMEMLDRYTLVTPLARTLAEKFMPGPLTLLLTTRDDTLASVASHDGAVGFRIPNHYVCEKLSRAFEKPITSTSVNRSGLPQAHSVRDMLAQLESSAHDVRYSIDCGELPGSTPSTIIDARGERAVLLRDGAISHAELADVIV